MSTLHRDFEISEIVTNIDESRMSNVLKKRRVLTIFVAKIHMSHCSPRSYAIITLKKINLTDDAKFWQRT